MIAINETLKVLPPEAKQEVFDFVEFIAQKYLNKQSKTEARRKDILSFSGSWKGMKEKDYQSFLSDVYKRREKSSRRRREI